MIILDTDYISLPQYRDSPQAFALQVRLDVLPPNDVVTIVIAMEEQLHGWWSLIRRYTDVHRQVVYYDRLLSLLAFFSERYILPFDQRAAGDSSGCGSSVCVLTLWTQERCHCPGA